MLRVSQNVVSVPEMLRNITKLNEFHDLKAKSERVHKTQEISQTTNSYKNALYESFCMLHVCFILFR